MASTIHPNADRISPTSRDRRRYIARIKNVCIAIPFDPNETLAHFQTAVLRRASNHRKLRHDLNLSERIEFIKLRSPHFPDLVDVRSLSISLCVSKLFPEYSGNTLFESIFNFNLSLSLNSKSETD